MTVYKDISAIVWKDTRELFSSDGVVKRNVLGLLIFIGLLGVYFPLMGGPSFVESPFILLFYVWFPIFMVMSIALDSFTGERERHTLETLLASRLSDTAIFFGKICSPVLYGSGMTIVCLMVGLIVVNVTSWNGYILMFPPWTIFIILSSSLLINAFITASGVLISLKATSVRVANEAMIGVMLAIGLLAIGAYRILPANVREWFQGTLFNMDINSPAIVIIGILLLLDFGILMITMTQYKRSKLILE